MAEPTHIDVNPTDPAQIIEAILKAEPGDSLTLSSTPSWTLTDRAGIVSIVSATPVDHKVIGPAYQVSGAVVFIPVRYDLTPGSTYRLTITIAAVGSDVQPRGRAFLFFLHILSNPA